MTKIGLTAVLIAVIVALTPAGAFAKGGRVSVSSNRNYHVTVPNQKNAPVNAHRYNAHRYYGGPKSMIPHGSQ